MMEQDLFEEFSEIENSEFDNIETESITENETEASNEECLEQGYLFPPLETKKIWETEWKDMPEFVCENIEPYKKIIVRFANKESFEDFFKIIGQPCSENTKAIWHPQLVKNNRMIWRYVNESE